MQMTGMNRHDRRRLLVTVITAALLLCGLASTGLARPSPPKQRRSAVRVVVDPVLTAVFGDSAIVRRMAQTASRRLAAERARSRRPVSPHERPVVRRAVACPIGAAKREHQIARHPFGSKRLID